MKLTDGSIITNTSDGLSEGLLLVMYNGSYFTVCENLFSQNAANITCKELGFNESERFSNISIRTE